MRILAVTPIVVSEDELRRRQVRYDSLKPNGVEVVLENLNAFDRNLTALDSEASLIASEHATKHHFRSADPELYDAFMPDCVLDPAIDTDQTRPVIGILESTVHFLASHNIRMAAIARNNLIADTITERVSSYLENKASGSFERTHTLDLSFEDIADTSKWNHRVNEVISSLSADVVINGCSAVEAQPRNTRPVVIDPTMIALEYANLRNQITLAQEKYE